MKICIGIDGGEHTGFAAWNCTNREFMELATLTFWEAIDRIRKYQFACTGKGHILEIHIEDVAANKSVFGAENTYKSTKADHAGKIRAVAKHGINIGKVMDKSNLMIDFCTVSGITVVRRKPSAGSMTKLSKEVFEKMTKIKTRTSQHARDAGMLVIGM